MKNSKVTNAHTSKSKMGSGDYYGTGVKQKVGKQITSTLDYSSPTIKKTKKPMNLA